MHDGLRRGGHLAPIKTSFDEAASRKSRRPRPIETIVYQEAGGRIPPAASSSPTLHRDSKFGLRSLFSRSKSIVNLDSEERSSVPHEDNEVTIRQHSGTTLRLRVSAAGDAHGVTNGSTMVPRKEIKDSKAGLKTERPSRPSRAWDPPPLFQAYPQAVKYGSLQASTLSADTILRISNHKNNKNLREQMMLSTLDVGSLEEDLRRKKPDEESKTHRRRMSSSTSKTEWTQKIYVLSTSGYLLEYSGDGSYDRLPEKVMQLGKDSAAFASDAIPGKHWVLQISQVATEDGVVALSATRSVLGRMKFRKPDCRKPVSSFLLILGSAEEMDGWLVAVRKEIEALGGKKYRPSIGSRKTTDEAVQTLRERPSRRYLVKRDPHRFQNPEGSREFSQGVCSGDESDISQPVNSAPGAAPVTSEKPRSYRTTASTETSSIGRDNIPDDRNLQDSSRLSYLSMGTRTLVASRGSSVATSSTKCDPVHADVSTTLHGLGRSSLMNKRHASMQKIPPALELRRESFDPCADHHAAGPQPTHADTEGSVSVKSLSPSTPNFSVPSFSKRYSIANASTPFTAPRLVPDMRPPTSPSSLGLQDSPNLSERPHSVVGKLSSEFNLSQASPNLPVKVRSSSTTLIGDTPKSSGQPFPRRFSSLEYGRNAPPSFANHDISLPPHPPPMTSLPAVPLPNFEHPNSTLVPSKNPKKLRRPASMQVGSKPMLYLSTTSSNQDSTHFSSPSNPSTLNPAPSTTTAYNHTSRQHFTTAPPTAPPNCPLPAPPPSLLSC